MWEVRVFTGRDEGGQPTQVSRTVHGTKKDAKRVAAELTMKPSNAGGRTVGELLDRWLELNEAGWSPTTRRDQASRVALIKTDRIARLAVARLTPSDVVGWHTRLRRSGVGDAAIRNRHLVLRAALSQAVRWGWLTTNPASAARLRQRKRAPREALTMDDVRAVLKVAGELGPAPALALRLAAVTGARRSEIAALRWDDLDGDRLRIDSAVGVVRHGTLQDKREPELIDDITKTANRRTVTVDDVTVRMWVDYQASLVETGEWVFGLFEPANPDRIGWWWTRARELSGIDKSWRLHDLRHWSATAAIGSGHDIRTVAGRLGHANAAMTLRVYAHVLENADRAVASTLSAALDDAMTTLE